MSGGALRVALALFLVFGTACGGSGGSGNGGAVTLQFWQFWDSGVIRPLLDKFEAENPGIKVNMKQLTWQNGKEEILAAVVAGTTPDLCELGSTWFAEFAGSGRLVDITAAADSMKSELRLWESATYDGKIYGVPWVMGTRALFYNKKLFRDAGLDPESAPDTWPRLTAAAAAINNPGKGIYGFGRNAGERYILFKKFMPFAWSIEGDVLSMDAKASVFNSGANVEALKYYLSLGELGLTEKQDILDQAFKQGKVGVIISGAWLFKTIPNDAPDLEYGVGLIPRPDDHWGTHKSFGGGELLVTFNNSKHPEAALKLARFLARGDNALELAKSARSVQPAAVGLENDPWFRDNPGQLVFLNQLSLAVFPPNIPEWTAIESAIEKWVEEAMYGRVTPEKAIEEADGEIRSILEGTAAGS